MRWACWWRFVSSNGSGCVPTGSGRAGGRADGLKCAADGLQSLATAVFFVLRGYPRTLYNYTPTLSNYPHAQSANPIQLMAIQLLGHASRIVLADGPLNHGMPWETNLECGAAAFSPDIYTPRQTSLGSLLFVPHGCCAPGQHKVMNRPCFQAEECNSKYLYVFERAVGLGSHQNKSSAYSICDCGNLAKQDPLPWPNALHPMVLSWRHSEKRQADTTPQAMVGRKTELLSAPCLRNRRLKLSIALSIKHSVAERHCLLPCAHCILHAHVEPVLVERKLFERLEHDFSNLLESV